MITYEYRNEFEKVNRIKEDIRLPERATMHSAGYDFFAIEDVTLQPNEVTIVMTGVKCRLFPDTALLLINRSSNPIKKGLVLANGVGLVDSDYYSNPTNDGEIGFEFYNISKDPVTIRKGDKLGQGVITRFNVAENDNFDPITGAVRTGGFGSTGE